MAGALAVVLAPMLLASGAGGSAPSSIGVNGGEYYLNLSRLKVDPGRATIEFVNEGMDAHNLLMKRKGRPRVTIASELGPGLTDERSVRLRRGVRYRLWCSLTTPVDHDDTGMNASLRVRNHT